MATERPTTPRAANRSDFVWAVAVGLLLLDAPDAAGQAPPSPPTVAADEVAPPPPSSAPPPQRHYVCPIDGTQTSARGSDGKDTTRRYSDLEIPTRAYTNLVVVCPKCGYAAWTGDFARVPAPAVADYAVRTLSRSARAADSDPVAAYQHLMNVLHLRRADASEQIGASQYYSYVLKRKRPYGGLDTALERKIATARKRTLTLLQGAMKANAPRQVRARLEWAYLAGELRRLIGDPVGAAPELAAVCAQRREAGYTIGRLACEMADRAERGESWEDYRDGVFDVRGIETAERDAERRRQEAERSRAAEVAQRAEAERARAKQAAGAASQAAPDRTAAPLPRPPTPVDDPFAPPPPPVAR